MDVVVADRSGPGADDHLDGEQLQPSEGRGPAGGFSRTVTHDDGTHPIVTDTDYGDNADLLSASYLIAHSYFYPDCDALLADPDPKVI